MNPPVLLGVIGGLGPMASVYFYEMLTEHTKVTCDQEHIDILLSSRASTPDRTAYILGQSEADPLPVMIGEARRLVGAGAELLVMPCNTAHYFYDGLAKAVEVPILNIIEETVRHCRERGMRKLGLLATEGTVSTGSYQKVCDRYGMTLCVPCPSSQKLVSQIIYDDVKQGNPPDMEKFGTVAYELRQQSCDTVILGCTELSLVKKAAKLGSYYTDSMEVLALATILRCGRVPCGFDFGDKAGCL